MPPQHSDDTLLTELLSHNAYFDSVVNMIPARLYVAGASGDDAHSAKYRKGQHKESKEARQARAKIAKRDKFRPEKMETTLEAQTRVRREQEEEDDESGDDEAADIDMSDGDGDEGDEDENDTAAATLPPATAAAIAEDSYPSRIEMLRAKLHAKMAEKRAAGGSAAAADTSAPALVSKRAARRAEKRKRKEAATQRNKKKAHTSTSVQKQSEQRVVKDLGGSTFNAPDPARPGSGDQASAAQDLATIDYQALAGLKPKLAGAFDDKGLTGGRGKKKSLEHLLADAERKQARLRELKRSATDEDKDKAKSIEWGEALKDASGATTRKTDPKLLKKALKRKSKQKTASSRAWNARVEQVKDAAAKKQQIRSHNLDTRKLGGSAAANLSSKRIVEQEGKDGEGGEKKEKRRRAGPHAGRAGFEGKKSGFINGEGSAAGGSGSGKGKK